MGHTRLGRLPETLAWRSVVALIDSSPTDVPAVARAVVAASDTRLQQRSNDPSLVHCFWILARLAAASREDDFAAALQRLELPVPIYGSALSYIAQVNDEVRLGIAGNLESGPFGEISSLALRRALSETMGHHGRSLFGSSLDDVQHAIRAHSTPRQFGQLARRFFGDYLARTMRFFVETELSNSVGPGHGLVAIEESQAFSQALDQFTHESARIVEDFAGEWYSKHSWVSGGQISRQDVEGFIAEVEGEIRRIKSILTAATGLAGRSRRFPTAADRARKSVSSAIDRAKKNNGDYHPPLFEHLKASIQTGEFCSYQHHPPPDWKT